MFSRALTVLDLFRVFTESVSTIDDEEEDDGELIDDDDENEIDDEEEDEDGKILKYIGEFRNSNFFSQ